ncbi:MAG: hypothetical protein JEZ07_16160 [Phycisphaerae bacterium]|nr:hypothetical protein [Phycisphaerae bacterium]
MANDNDLGKEVEKELIKLWEEKKAELDKSEIRDLVTYLVVGGLGGASIGYWIHPHPFAVVAGLICGLQSGGDTVGGVRQNCYDYLRLEYCPNSLRGHGKYNRKYIESLGIKIPEDHSSDT